jgi:uracil-DNA glycosylase family 4
VKNKLLSIIKQIDADNPLEMLRQISAPLNMEKLNQLISNCDDCKTSTGNKKFAYGNPDANIMIITNVATDDESVNDYFNDLMDIAEIDKKEIFFVNAVSCVCDREKQGTRIDRTPNINEVKNCKYFVDYAIDFVKPRIIISMGATSLSMYMPQTTLQDEIGKTLNFNGVKTIVTYSVKDIFEMARWQSEEDNQGIADEVLNALVRAKEYIDSIREA